MHTKRLGVGTKQLEYVWYGPAPEKAPTLVFLHEGLGCVAMWRDFPEMLAERTGCGALVYSRAGYGKSDAAELPRSVRFMHDEALNTLPQVLDEFQINEAILVGHSDGGSIAIIHAGGDTRERLRGLLLEAPHVFVEEFGLQSIRRIARDYQNGDLKHRLERYHGAHVDETFWGWNDIWLEPQFKGWNIEEYLPLIDVPVLVIQGEDDQYGTIDQVRAIEAGCAGPVKRVFFQNCGHSPHVDQPERTLKTMTEFVLADLAR